MKEKDPFLKNIKIDSFPTSFDNSPNFKKGYEIFTSGGVNFIKQVRPGFYKGETEVDNKTYFTHIKIDSFGKIESKCDNKKCNDFPGICIHGCAILFEIIKEYGYSNDAEDSGFFADDYL